MVKDSSKQKYEKEYLKIKQNCRNYYNNIKVIGTNPFFNVLIEIWRSRTLDKELDIHKE